jgi:hypothetical protein
MIQIEPRNGTMEGGEELYLNLAGDHEFTELIFYNRNG